jgi:SAM-dependent methyltransferase
VEIELYAFHKYAQDIHWWFIGRNKIINHYLRNLNFPNGNQLILDIGSCYGGVLPILSKFGTVDVIEPMEEAHTTLRERGAQLIHNDLESFPKLFPDRRYNLVTMFDTLEHIEDDQYTLQLIEESILAENGYLVLTVPAYNWLWSIHDDKSHHYRRYTKKVLLRKIENANLIPVKSTYFMTLLFPIAVIQRVYLKLKPDLQNELTIPPRIFNSICTNIFSFESRIIEKIPFLFGLSILVVCRKK